jgi:6-pyruvoyl-tetrahydropterin synthase
MRTISAAHHNGPDGNKCQRNHGHDWGIHVTFEYGEEDLDAYGWGPDFGKIKKVLDSFDHQDLNTLDQFHGKPASAEHFALVLVQALSDAVGMRPNYLSVDEGNGNTIQWSPDDD